MFNKHTLHSNMNIIVLMSQYINIGHLNGALFKLAYQGQAYKALK